MSDRFVIGVDVGSGSAKAGVFDLSGRLHASASVAYEPTTPAPGVAEYDAVAVQDASVEALARALQGVDATKVEAVAVDAMMSGAVPVDEAGVPVGPYTTTLDTRFAPHLDRFLAGGWERCRALTGSGQPTLAPKIAWIEDAFPDVAARTARYVLAGSLVAGRFAGLGAQDAFVDASYLWTTGLADAATLEWSPELCAVLGTDVSRLPRIVQSTDTVGAITVEVAAATGLRAGTPVVAGCGDQSAGYVGAGAARPGVGADSAGTYAVVAGVTGAFDPRLDPDAPDVVAVPSGSAFNVQSMVVGGGLTRQWAARLFGVTSADVDADVLAAEPGARGVRFAPHLGGQAYPARPEARGAWVGMTWVHTPVDLYQAVLEGVALANGHAFARMRDLYPDLSLDRVVVFGGGTRSGAWSQIKADVTGVPYACLGDAPVTGRGAAMLAAQGVGLVDDATAVCAANLDVVRTFVPDERRHAAYQGLLQEHLDLVDDLAAADARRV